MKASFASDNASGIHPRVLEALTRANAELPFSSPYGEDPVTSRVTSRIENHFSSGENATARAWLMFNGTGANIAGLSAILRPYEAVVCASSAHVEMDECGALERFSGSRTIPVGTLDGKLRSADIEPLLWVRGTVHHAQPRVILISQSTECGTLYTPAEIQALADFAHSRGLLLYLDGARLANACAALGLSLRALTVELGVDALTFGGTKNGLIAGEAVVYLGELARGPAAESFPFVRKQAMQLASKMRFVAAQFEAYLDNELWLVNARHANAMAERLRAGLNELPGLELAWESQANALFPILRDDVMERLQKDFYFYRWSAAPGRPGHSIARWMTSFETNPEEVDTLLNALSGELAQRHPYSG